MFNRRFPVVAQEGVPPLLALMAVAVILVHFVGGWYVVLPLAAFVVLVLLFRDPHREIPPVALGVVSPVDGEVDSIDFTRDAVSQGEAHRIRIRINSLGTYTARSPVEGLIKNLAALAGAKDVDYRTNALWLQTDEGDDVVLQFDGYRLGLAPKALQRYGERVGQGQRCAYLRLTRFAELHLPADSQIEVEVGASVTAGTTLLGYLPHP